MCDKITWYPLLSNDLFIFLVVTFAIVNILTDWHSFEYFPFRKCSQPIHVWLLIALIGITFYRLLSIFLVPREDEDDDDEDIFKLKIFRRENKLYTFILVGLVYPLFFFWTLLGTVWYIEDTVSSPSLSSSSTDLQASSTSQLCFTDQNTTNWYFLAWLLSFYTVIIISTTTIMYAWIVSYRSSIIESQYQRLLEQYEGPERPEMNFNLNGLSPAQISSIPIEVLPEPDGVCPVCIDSFRQLERTRVLPCGHKYHLACIDRWLMQHTVCPLCKADCVVK